ncbi:LamG domain-containing protein [Streptomyces sp. TLI_171]|uniref:LamG domain-containing protein n=1 Tax=Streptomyces sp. TLI_171 TaxID=1938859 RepID=UPI000C194259|nr:LamG domain-containing protein [Streptomyces sp. TLI_171]
MTSSTPDWAALADAREREERRRRLLRIGGGAVVVTVVGGLVAAALVLTRPSGTPGAQPAPSVTLQPDGTAAPTPADSPVPSAQPSAGGSASSSPTASGSPSASGKGTGKPSAGKTSAVPGTLPGMLLGSGTALGPTEGHSGPTMVLYGNGIGWADSQTPVVDTTRSFTVSALVRNNAPTGGRAVITQGSDSYYSFYLGRDYWGTHNQWVFKVQTAAGAQDNTTYQAFGTGTATTGQWTLLTGVYDASAKKILLYVNGTLQQSTPVTGIWQTTGGLQLGRVRYKSAWSDFWDGAIADVQIWEQALPGAAVAKLHSSGGTSAGPAAGHSWLMP